MQHEILYVGEDICEIRNNSTGEILVLTGYEVTEFLKDNNDGKNNNT